jgi:hypothetical protein
MIWPLYVVIVDRIPASMAVYRTHFWYATGGR